MKITHVIFDFDGTLVSTVEMATLVLDEWVQSEGAQLNVEIRDYMANVESFETLAKMINEQLGLNLNVSTFKHELFDRCQPKGHLLQLKPGVEKLVKHLHAHGILMAVASGNAKKNNDAVVGLFDGFFETYMSHIVNAMDDAEVVHKKPDPCIYLVCASRFHTPPASMSNVIIIEDSPTIIQGAIDSGAHTVLVSQSPSADKFVSKVSLKIDSLEQFKPEAFGLPAFDA